MNKGKKIEMEDIADWLTEVSDKLGDSVGLFILFSGKMDGTLQYGIHAQEPKDQKTTIFNLLCEWANNNENALELLESVVKFVHNKRFKMPIIMPDKKIMS